MSIRILHLIETLSPGGAEKRLINDIKYLNKNIFSHTICHIFKGSELKGEISEFNIPIYSLELEKNNELIKGLVKLARIVRKIRPNIIHTQLFAADIYGRIIGKFFRIPVVSTIQSSVYEPGIEFFRSPRRQWLDSITGRLCNRKFIAVSNFVKTSVIKQLGFPEKNIEVIHNYLDIKKIGIVDYDCMAFRKNLGLNEGDFILVTVGKLNPPKGHSYLLRAMAKVTREYPQVKLLIVGDGPSREELILLSGNLGLSKHVIFMGNKQNIKELLSVSDVFVFPSLNEGFPVSLLEAMAFKKTCIAFNLGPMPEAIQNNVSGILVTPKDMDALARAIICLIKDPQQRDRLGQAARNTILDKFTNTDKVTVLERIYQNLYTKK